MFDNLNSFESTMRQMADTLYANEIDCSDATMEQLTKDIETIGAELVDFKFTYESVNTTIDYLMYHDLCGEIMCMEHLGLESAGIDINQYSDKHRLLNDLQAIQEGFGETIKNIWEKIKTFFGQIFSFGKSKSDKSKESNATTDEQIAATDEAVNAALAANDATSEEKKAVVAVLNSAMAENKLKKQIAFKEKIDRWINEGGLKGALGWLRKNVTARGYYRKANEVIEARDKAELDAKNSASDNTAINDIQAVSRNLINIRTTFENSVNSKFVPEQYLNEAKTIIGAAVNLLSSNTFDDKNNDNSGTILDQLAKFQGFTTKLKQDVERKDIELFKKLPAGQVRGAIKNFQDGGTFGIDQLSKLTELQTKIESQASDAEKKLNSAEVGQKSESAKVLTDFKNKTTLCQAVIMLCGRLCDTYDALGKYYTDTAKTLGIFDKPESTQPTSTNAPDNKTE